MMLAARGVKSGSQRNIGASTETLSNVSVGLNHGSSSGNVLPSPHTPVVGGTIFNRVLQRLKEGTAHLAHQQSSHHEARQTAKGINLIHYHRPFAIILILILCIIDIHSCLICMLI